MPSEKTSPDDPAKRKPRKPRKLEGPAPLPEVDYIQLPLTPSLENWLCEGSVVTGLHLDEAASIVLEQLKDRAHRSFAAPADESPLPNDGPPAATKISRLKVPISSAAYDKLKELAGSAARQKMGRTAGELLESAARSETAKSLLSEQVQALKALSEHRASSPAAETEISDRLNQQPDAEGKPR